MGGEPYIEPYWHGGEPPPWSSVRRDGERLQALCDGVAEAYVKSQGWPKRDYDPTYVKPVLPVQTPWMRAQPGRMIVSPALYHDIMASEEYRHLITEQRVTMSVNVPGHDDDASRIVKP